MFREADADMCRKCGDVVWHGVVTARPGGGEEKLHEHCAKPGGAGDAWAGLRQPFESWKSGGGSALPGLQGRCVWARTRGQGCVGAGADAWVPTQARAYVRTRVCERTRALCERARARC